MAPGELLLRADELRCVRGERLVLRGLSLEVRRGDRLALLGDNGAGKTTLLRLLSGELLPDSGEVWRAPHLRLGAVTQHADFAPGQSVGTLVAAANPYRVPLAELRRMAALLEQRPEYLREYQELHSYLDHHRAYHWPARRDKILSQLALTPFLEREARTLSGGESARLSLALSLLTEPELLLLDEPTNHLDIRMREWLEHWLRSRGSFVVTSHDREFLDRVAQRSLWLSEGEGRLYPGGYSRALSLRSEEHRRARKVARMHKREQKRLERSAARLALWGQSSQGVKRRALRLPEREAPLPERERRLQMRLLAGEARAPLLLWAKHLSADYAGKTVLRDVSLRVRRGDRAVLMGANGAGKTTLLRLLAGELFPAPQEPPAHLQYAAGVTAAYLDQTWHGLTPTLSLHEQFSRRFGARAAALLGQAGLSQDAHKRPAELSGGERARAGLALISALRADLLLLDEPTNHLDIQALQALEGAVQAYPGAVIIVTHDRRFAREVGTRFWQLEGGALRESERWEGRAHLDPARALSGDPAPALPEWPKASLRHLEDRLSEAEQRLGQGLSGREEGRLLAQRANLRAQLYEAYAQAYAAPLYDAQTRERGLTIRAQRLERGGMFWVAHNESCPHLAWDGQTLRFSAPAPAWYGSTLLAGALRILFEQWRVTRVQLGEGGPLLERRRYFELEEIIEKT